MLMPATELRERNEWFRSEYNSRRRDPEELRGAGDSGRISNSLASQVHSSYPEGIFFHCEKYEALHKAYAF